MMERCERADACFLQSGHAECGSMHNMDQVAVMIASLCWKMPLAACKWLVVGGNEYHSPPCW